MNEVCKQKKVGGLGIRNIDKGNETAVGKLAWHVANLSESLWVRWVHGGVYTKGGNWAVFNPPITVIWSLKKICRIKDKPSAWISQGKYNMNDFFQDTFKTLPKVSWSRFVWNRSSTPKSNLFFG